ncbi:MAG: DUF5916 domain-containing protein [Anaeromyxobacter sp.]
MTTALRALALLLTLALPAAARPDEPGAPIQAARRDGRLTIDGRLEERDWEAARPFDGFIQRFPNEGAPPSERTEVRVLFDDRALYVGIHAHDSRPGEIHRPLGRRDAAPAWSDEVQLYIDSTRDGRSAFSFAITAAGVQSDGIVGDDDDYNPDWDAVWEGAASATADGWSAEVAIPLAALRFSNGAAPVFGFGMKRYIGRNHEEDFSISLPRSTRGEVAHLARLEGLSGLAAVNAMELAPYVAARVTRRPQYDDALQPQPRLTEPYGDVGLDLKTTIGRGLSLQGTINPDFGQVEADQIVQNLSSFELFFPEKRPFFTQGMDIFRPLSAPNRQPPHQLFYSRRIGLDAPILAAAKLTGAAGDTLQLGVLEALVTGAGSGDAESAPVGQYRFHGSQPFRIGPETALPQVAPATRNFLTGVARWRPDPTRTFGFTATSTLLAGPDCTPEENDLDDDVRPARCDALAGNAAAVDWGLRTRDGQWFFRGQADGSQALGGAPERTLADGTVLKRGDLGVGAYAAAGRGGGEPWRFELQWEYQSPRLELNAAGYQRTQNEQVGRLVLRHVRPSGGGPFQSWIFFGGAETKYTTDDRQLRRGGQLWAGAELELRSFHWLGFTTVLDFERWDVREMDQTGVAQRRPGDAFGELWFSSDPGRPVRLEALAGAGWTFATGDLQSHWFGNTEVKLILRPHPRLETRLELRGERAAWPARFVLDDGEGRYLFADLVAPSVSTTLRQQVVLTPRLTLQAYAQLFSSYGRYTRYREAGAPDGRVDPGDLHEPSQPLPAYAGWENPDFREGVLNLNVVLRWEYRLGSTLFLVYTRSQSELGYEDEPTSPSPPATVHPVNLASGPVTDTFMAKWTWWFSR